MTAGRIEVRIGPNFDPSYEGWGTFSATCLRLHVRGRLVHVHAHRKCCKKNNCRQGDSFPTNYSPKNTLYTKYLTNF